MEQRFHDVFTSVQLIVKFDLWDDEQERQGVGLTEIWLAGTRVPVLR